MPMPLASGEEWELSQIGSKPNKQISKNPPVPWPTMWTKNVA